MLADHLHKDAAQQKKRENEVKPGTRMILTLPDARFKVEKLYG